MHCFLLSVLALLSGCAELEDVPITLAWYATEVPCVSAVAEWVAPEGLVAFSYRAKERDLWAYRSGGTVSADGVLSVGCVDDISLVYALEE